MHRIPSGLSTNLFYGSVKRKLISENSTESESNLSPEVSDIDDLSSDGSNYEPSVSETSEFSDDSAQSSDAGEEAEGSFDDNQQHIPMPLWHAVDGSNQKTFQFVSTSLNINANDIPRPIDVYNLMLTGEILDLIAEETNRNYYQTKAAGNTRLQKWIDTDREEVKKFLGIIMYMGIVKYPKISQYWSKDPFYKNSFLPGIMPRNRFQSLLRFVHFADNQSIGRDRLGKIRKLLELLEKSFTNNNIPDEDIAVDESIVPWRGQLKFRQYNPGKSHKYGIKVYKLCDPQGYTYTSYVYAGKEDCRLRGRPSEEFTHASQIVLDLAKDYLNKGRTIVTDNFYTSIVLAKELLKHQTHLVGTLRANRKGVPKEVTNSKLKKGEIFGQQQNDGIVIAKWKDKRDVLMLSTKHDLSEKGTGRHCNNIELKKPEMIICYNSVKQGIGISDQMGSYFTPLRKAIRWYHKIAFEYLLNTAVVNSMVLFKNVHHKTVTISEFRKSITESLCKMDGQSREPRSLQVTQRQNNKRQHSLKSVITRDKSNRLIRRRCFECYFENRKIMSAKDADKKTKKVNTYCSECEGSPALCLECFQTRHK